MGEPGNSDEKENVLMIKQRTMSQFKKYLAITVGCFFLGSGIALFLDPNRIAPGGVTGIAIILSKLIPVNTGLLILLMNIPLLIVGLVRLGKSVFIATAYATVMLSSFTDIILYLMHSFDIASLTDDLLLAALFGGALCAVGLGIVFRMRGTTGGLDIIVMLIHKRWRHLEVGKIFLIVDFIIAGISALVFKDIEIGLYACVSIIVYSVLMDVVIYGGNGANMVYIVSNHSQSIKEKILKGLEIGVTDIKGTGGYTGNKKTILLCVIRKHMYPKLRDIVRENDPDAFMIVSDVHEVYGLGFRSHHDDI